jgi:glycosyltransferase involved in cell wall biosynthesis
MRIVEIAAIEEKVPPEKYGGTELVVHNVTEGLVQAGHEVYLLASGDSETSANLVPLVEKSLRRMYSPEEIEHWRDYMKVATIPDILKHIKEIKPDIVHNHLNWRLLLFADLIECPVISTMHGPLASLRERETYGKHKNSNYVSISDNQRKAMPELNWVKTVYNGIDVGAFDLETEKGDYFAFLGRTSPEKGLEEICRMVRESKQKHKLKIAAKVDTVDKAYFETHIRPYIDGDQIEFLDEVDHAGKNELLKNAKALLLWLNWEEPFGLVVPEANACGTPVIVNPRGSMPELVKDGVNGFLVNSLAEMEAKLDEVQAIDPVLCRLHAEQNYSKEKMVRDYEEVMRSLLA